MFVKKTNYEYVKKHRQNYKRMMTAAFESKCGICGYNKSLVALDFHHLNEKEKEFTIRNKIKAWSKLVEELRKCVLLCSNCHREVHGNITKIPKNIIRFNEKYAVYEPYIEGLYDNCPICERKKLQRRKFCSLKCSGKNQRRVDWDNIDLIFLSKKYNYTELGKMFNVSDNTIKKQLINQKRA